jgi:hypothetical protein
VRLLILRQNYHPVNPKNEMRNTYMLLVALT